MRQALTEVLRMLRVVRKPSRREFMLMLKVCSLGLAILGVYGFIILYLSFVFLYGV
ncbi:MAG: protein translocase SEC61 complex subunit gamma [Candidatus Nezhaarchaeota archaeon]|nr:protein translocase SEC61 complex subunit gamma [Candidatus Nezhaarchaeota archaeon]